MKTSTDQVRAFRVDVTNWPEGSSIVRTLKPSRAKFITWQSAKEAGFDLPFGRFRVRRAPEFDGTCSLHVGRCYGVDYAENLFS